MTSFPFTAIVGLDQAKKSLIYQAIDPRLGGTLLLGHRGCAKSTLVRAFAKLLRRPDGQPAPFCEVPLGITEDRLLGSVDPEGLIENKEWRVRSGLLEKAHQGILYIDEVNLLPDHLADLILDSAASGVHHLERDGFARVVESRYLLVGTMNPEEGQLRPQLLDRFAHGVRIVDDFSEDERMMIVQRRLEFDDDPIGFSENYRRAETRLSEQIQSAREVLAQVSVSPEHRRAIAQRGRELQVEGLRTELAVLRTARCIAAWQQRQEISTTDLEEAWTLCLNHRQEHTPPSSPSLPPPPSNSGQRPSGLPATDASTKKSSSSPQDAHTPHLEIQAVAAPDASLLSRWWQQNSPSVRSGATSSLTPLGEPTPIAWLPSFVASMQAGWPTASFRLSRARMTKKRSFWIFLDASRSTGMSGFLARAQALLLSASWKFTGPISLLLLHENRLRWLCQKTSWASTSRALAEIKTAAGGSNLADALTQFHRALLRQRHTLPYALIFTDGYNRRRAHESIFRSQERLNFALSRIKKTSANFVCFLPKHQWGKPQLTAKLTTKFRHHLHEI